MTAYKKIAYNSWGFVRQTAVRAGLIGEKIAFRATKGRYPKELFSYRAGTEKVGTTVRPVKTNNYSPDYAFNIAKYDASGNICDDDFVILSSTDFHFDDDADMNAKTVEMFVRQIKEIKPDLVVLTGDVILSKYQQSDAIKFAQMMEKLGIYWTAVFGNHETREERGFYKWLMLKSFSDYKHCLVMHGPEDLFGYGNFTINIFGKNNRLRETLFFFDSGRDVREYTKKQYNLPADFSSYDFLKREQIDFYKNEIDRLTKIYGEFNSMMYMHIPLPEYAHAFTATDDGRYVPSGECEILYGEQYESVGSSAYNSGMFDAILEKGSTKAVFAGHDHINDWCAIYKGIYLVYSLPQGYNPYHMGTNTDKPESEWVQGVTVTTLHPDDTFEIKPSYNRKYLISKENANGK